jgi:hypothetical protein
MRTSHPAISAWNCSAGNVGSTWTRVPSGSWRMTSTVGVSGPDGSVCGLFENVTTRVDPSSNWQSKYHHSKVESALPAAR